MKKITLVLITLCIMVTGYAQKSKSTGTNAGAKSFIVTAATAKDLPEGVAFINEKVTIKAGFKFESLPNSEGINVVNAKGVITGTFRCACGSLNGLVGKCSTTADGPSIRCSGSTCCSMQTTVNTTKISDMQMRQN